MNRFSIVMAFVVGMWLAPAAQSAHAAPCLIVTLTGTQSGPPVFNGQAGAGTLVSYGDDGNNCGAMKLQFDTGRGTNMRLSQIGVPPGQLNAISSRTCIQIIRRASPTSCCCAGTSTRRGRRSMWSVARMRYRFWDSRIAVGNSSCILVTHSSSPARSRSAAPNTRLAGGPADLTNVITFEPQNEPQVVWSSGDVKVSAIRSTHIAGHASYRMDTPAGSVVIGGDAGNDVLAPPRTSSTSDEVEKLAKGVDIIVHSTMHPVMGPDRDSGMPPAIFYRQSGTTDLGAMAKRVGAKHLMLTHLGPPIGAVRQGPWKIPGGPLTEADYRKAVEASGFTGNTIVGVDLATLRLPAK